MNDRFDPYQVLGVARDADAAAIKKAFRRLAKENHPDRGGDPERFKAMNRANEVLSDPEKRAVFDQYGPISLESGFDPSRVSRGPRPGSGFEGGPNVDDLLSQLFGRGRGFPGAPPRGVRAELHLDLRTAVAGGIQQLSTPSGSMKVRIPSGVRDGETIRLKGQGERLGGGPGSDLHLTLAVAAHPVFHREGEDLHVDLPITVAEAVAGASVRVPTIDGAVDLKVPAHSEAAQVLRVRGKGVTRRGHSGDLYVHLVIALPSAVDPSVLEAMARAYDHDVRGDLLRAAAA